MQSTILIRVWLRLSVMLDWSANKQNNNEMYLELISQLT